MINNRLRGCALNLFTFNGNGTRLRFDQCVYGIGKFFLAVAVNACKTNNLAGTNIQIKAVYLLNTALVLDVEVLNRENNLARSCWLLFYMQVNVSTHHKCCKLGLGCLGDINGAHVLAATNNGALVSRRHNLFKLVRNNNDGFTFAYQVMHDLNKLLNLLRCKNCRRLIKNQRISTAIQGLQNLNTLLHTNRNVFNLGVRVYVKAVFLNNLQDLLTSSLWIKDATSLSDLVAQNNIFCNSKVLDQHKVLVNHTNTVSDSIGWARNGYTLSVEVNLALISRIQAIQYVHKRTFTCAVLS